MIPEPPAVDAPRPTADDINRQIRRLSAGRAVWTEPELAELACLRAEWQAAVAREQELAA